MNIESLVIVGVLGGLGAAGSYAAYNFVDKIGPELQPGDLLPTPPWEGLPKPRFVKRDPDLLPRALKSMWK